MHVLEFCFIAIVYPPWPPSLSVERHDLSGKQLHDAESESEDGRYLDRHNGLLWQRIMAGLSCSNVLRPSLAASHQNLLLRKTNSLSHFTTLFPSFFPVPDQASI